MANAWRVTEFHILFWARNLDQLMRENENKGSSSKETDYLIYLSASQN